MEPDRKPYAPPTLTTHGEVVKETRGFGGRLWEMLVSKASGVGEVEDDD